MGRPERPIVADGGPVAEFALGLRRLREVARAGVLRDRLSGTRTLIILDNALDEAQVLPLLPAASGCLVLVTSRKRLKALDDALLLPMGLLPSPDAVSLLRRISGPHLADDHDHDPLIERIAELCGLLPLALRIAATLVRGNSPWTLERLVERLSQRPAGRELVGYTDGVRNLAAIFDLSYQALGDDQRLLFRRLGVAPGTDVDTRAAAALAGWDESRARDVLEELVDHNLLAEHAADRYRMHDLIRAQARTLAETDPRHERDEAVSRLLSAQL